MLLGPGSLVLSACGSMPGGLPQLSEVQAAVRVAFSYKDFLLCKLQVAKDGHT